METKCSALQILENELAEAGSERLLELAETISSYAKDAARNNNSSEAEIVCRSALDLLSKVHGPAKGKGTLNRMLSSILYKQGHYRKSFKYCLTAAKQMENAEEIQSAALLYGNCGTLLYHMGDSAGAYRKHLRVLNMAQKNNLKIAKAQALVNISLILTDRMEYSEALDNVSEATAIFRETGDKHGEAYALSAAALIKSTSGYDDEGIKYQRHALALREILGNKRELLLSLINISGALVKVGRAEEAKPFCIRALKITDGTNWPDLHAVSLLTLAEIHFEMGFFDASEKALLRAKELFADSEGFEESRSKLILLESKIYEENENFRKACSALRNYIVTVEELHKEGREEQITNMRIASKIEADLKERELLAEKNVQLSKTNDHLREALAQVKTLSGMLPICPSCKRIRNDEGYWQQVEAYISTHTDAQCKHSFCNECLEKLYPELSDDVFKKW